MQAPSAPWAYQRNGPLSPAYSSFGGGPVAAAGRSMNDPGRMLERIGRQTRRDPRMQLAVADRFAAPAEQTVNGVHQPYQSRNAQQGQQSPLSGLDWLYGGTNQAAGAVVPPAGGSQPAKPAAPQPQQGALPSPLMQGGNMTLPQNGPLGQNVSLLGQQNETEEQKRKRLGIGPLDFGFGSLGSGVLGLGSSTTYQYGK